MKKKMLIIGLTGGIGMGKTTAARILRRMGFPVHDADQAVHALLRKGGRAVKPVAAIFPEAIKNGAIDRSRLGLEVFRYPARRKKLEEILHPLVQRQERKFLQAARRAKASAAILDIPLLFETKAEKRCDLVVLVTAQARIQKERVTARPNMTLSRFRAIRALQMPDTLKQKKADHIIRTDLSPADTEQQLRTLFEQLNIRPSP